jgi:hypothetical protein
MLYHFSDDPNIKVFTPRVVGNSLPLVWAIDEEHCVNYYFPRQCPRIIYGKSDNSSTEDIAEFFDGTTVRKVITIPDYMEEELRSAVIYKYIFNEVGFELRDENAGYHTCPNNVVPINVEPLANLPELIRSAGADLRFTDDLLTLRERILNSTIDNFSMIRLKNYKSL